MLKKITKFSTFAFALMFICTSAFGLQNKYQKDNLDLIVKGGDEIKTGCKREFSIGSDKPCIGGSKDKCNQKSVEIRSNDEWGIILMIARETTIGGAKFCPTIIVASNENENWAWTEYVNTDMDRCVWLCRSGKTGSTCEQDATTITSCDAKPLKQSDFDDITYIKYSGGTNIESTIPNYTGNHAWRCYGSKDRKREEEHDLILAISNWLPSGRGAYVRPYVVQSHRDGWEDMKSWIDLYFNTNSQTALVCKNGFKPNAKGNDCEPIDYDVCGVDKMCDGWNESKYDESKHTKITVGDCVQWRCKDESHGLTSVGGAECKKCDSGKAVSAKTGKCATAIVISKDRMLYGKNGNAVTTPLDQQCWTKTDPTEYYKCVMNETQPETSEPTDTADNADTQE